MSLRRVKAILIQELFITVRSVEVINDLFFFPIFANIIIFGLLTVYLNATILNYNATPLLVGMIFWQPLWIVSYSIGVGTLWNVWSRNLTNIFITPVNLYEYFIAYGISGFVKGLIVFIVSYILAIVAFHINVLSLGLPLITVFFLNVSLFGFSLGVFILALIFRWGTRISALSWGLVGVLQPLMSVVYPVSILPEPFKSIAWIFPPTYIFEAARKSLETGTDVSSYIINAIILNFVYLICAVIFFNFMFRKSKQVGQFAKLET